MADIVSWLGAVQAQDYTGAKWAIGQRGSGLTDAAVDGTWTGSWKRTIAPRSAAIEVKPRRTLTRDEQRVLDAEGARNGAFLGVPVSLKRV